MQLEALLLDSTVTIEAAANQGSGFFVGPGLIVTCAHVIEDPSIGDYPLSDVRVRWGGSDYPAQVIRYAASPDPDVAVLKVDVGQNPAAYLFDPMRAEDSLVVCASTDSNSLKAIRVSIDKLEAGGAVLRLESGQSSSLEGLDGAPVLNLRTGAVCALLRSTRDVVRATRVGTIGRFFPEVSRIHDAHHQASRQWFESPDGVRTVTAARSYVLAMKAACEEPIQRLLSPKNGVNAMELLVPSTFRPWIRNGVQGDVSDGLALLEASWEQGRGLLIVGPTGSGRSSVLRSFGYQAALEFPNLGALAKRSVFPILVRANQLTSNSHSVEEPLLHSMAVSVGVNPSRLPSRFLTDLADVPGLRLLVMVDGIDEIQDKRDLAELVGFIGRIQDEPVFGSQTQLVATSRTSTAEHFRYSNFDVYEVRPLDAHAVRLAVERWLGSASEFMQENGPLVASGLLSSPLNLAISLRLFERNRSTLPHQVVQLYQDFVDACVADWRRQELGRIYGADLIEHARELLGFIALELLRSGTTFDREWLRETAARFFAEFRAHDPGRSAAASVRVADFLTEQSVFLGTLGDQFYWSHLSFRDFLAAWSLVRLYAGTERPEREIEERWFDTNWGKVPVFAFQLLPDADLQARLAGAILSSGRSARLNFVADLIRDGADLPTSIVNRFVEALVDGARQNANGSDGGLVDSDTDHLDLLLSLAHVSRAREELERICSDDAWPGSVRTRARRRLNDFS